MNVGRGFFRPRISTFPLSIITSLFLVALANQTFWAKIHLYLADYPGAIWALYLSSGLLFFALMTAFSLKYSVKPAFILMIVAAAIGSWFTDTFGVLIDSDMVRNAFQTTPAEAQHLITTGFLIHMMLFAILPIGLLLWVHIDHQPFVRALTYNIAMIAASIVIAAIGIIAFNKPYTAAVRQHKDIVKSLNPISPIAGTIKFIAQSTIDANVTATPLGTDARVFTSRNASKKPRVNIIVAGETARAANFSLGGYSRVTNPELAKKDIIYFPHTTSCGTATAVSIPCMFSQFTRKNYSHRKGLEHENLVDVLKHADIDVAWWDNNSSSKGVADRITYKSLLKTNDPKYCTNRECQDDILLAELDTWLDSVKKDSVLVLHTMGSHGPTYHLRYPAAFNRFKPACETAELGQCTDEEIVNAYDNTILFTDYILSSIIDKLNARSETMETSMIYMSDHGESLGENGIYLHGLPYMLAPDVQTRVPFLMWFDTAFVQSMKLDRACLQQKSTQEYSHDYLFHSVLSMMNIQTHAYDSTLDIFASCRMEKLS